MQPASWPSIRRDVELSILSSMFFALCATLIMSAYDAGLTLLHTTVCKHELWYAGFSFIGVLFLQDLYFYWVHRAFHHPLLFKWLHWGHHQSGVPTPWTSFAFDLPEAIVQGLFFVGIVFLIPLHVVTLIAVLITMTVWSVLTHLGFEPFTSSSLCRWFGRWFIGPTHHLIHHRKYRLHFGLYFTLWDRLLNTQDPDYEDEFAFPSTGK